MEDSLNNEPEASQEASRLQERVEQLEAQVKELREASVLMLAEVIHLVSLLEVARSKKESVLSHHSSRAVSEKAGQCLAAMLEHRGSEVVKKIAEQLSSYPRIDPSSLKEFLEYTYI